VALEQIGKYRIVGKIGQGAMGSVYKGLDAALGRHVAIKVISADGGADETARKRFQREAEAAARLNHPHIVTVFDFGEDHDRAFLVMELLEGMDLKEAIAAHRLKTLDEKLEVLEQVCDGLAFAHQNAIVHRDLKPANIHLLPDGQVKIMDFGLARLSGSDMTRTGLVMGTPHYMSPEQVRGEHVDTRSDVFSLGAVFYELLTEKKPFDAESLHSVLYMVLQAQPRPPRELVPDLPVVVEQLLERAMARDREGRFADASEFYLAVQHVREAIAAGRGDELIPELDGPLSSDAPPVLAGAAMPSAGFRATPEPPSARSGSRSASRSGTASRSGGARGASASRIQRKRGPGVLPYVIGGVVLAGIVGTAWLMTRRGPEPVASTRSGAPDKLTQAVVNTEIELAKKRLAAGDYEDAIRRADRALSLIPSDKAAKEILASARKAKEQVDQVVAEARTAADGADTARSVDAFWKLLQLAPDNAAAGEIAPKLDSTFRPRAEEALRLAVAARSASEEAKAERSESYHEGSTFLKDGESALKVNRKYAFAAWQLMRARARFERAQRTGR
jgi:predicted Ser/Thr protein kinase/tetratricopeptide (TPR) repeat protein